MSRNPCFSGQCFAIAYSVVCSFVDFSRNPCFSGQCFAIPGEIDDYGNLKESQSLF